MDDSRQDRKGWGGNLLMALFFAAIGSLIIIVFSPLRPVLEEDADYLGRIGLILLLGIAVYLVRKSALLEKYTPIVLGLLILHVAVSLDWVLGIYLLSYLGVPGNTPAGIAILKLNECAVVVCVVILFTRMSGGSLGSIYIQKGNLRSGLLIGLIAFFICVTGSIPMAALMFNSNNLTVARIIPWIPPLLVTVLANAAQEELLFRGLFLRKLQPFLGKFLSNLLIVIVFTLLHKGVTYSANEYLFLAIVVLFSLAWGYVMQKTDSIWGSILFHAGTDIPVFLGIFSNLT